MPDKKPDVVRVKFSMSAGNGVVIKEDVFTFDREEWESWSEEDRQRELLDWTQAYVDTYYEEEDDQ